MNDARAMDGDSVNAEKFVSGLASKARCIHPIFEEQVRRAPDAVAIRWGDGALTYGELNRAANAVAHRLRREGVGRDSLVGLCVERSPEMVVGLLGILKAGGAYVPLDPDLPGARLMHILDEIQASVVLVQAHLVERMESVMAGLTEANCNEPAPGARAPKPAAGEIGGSRGNHQASPLTRAAAGGKPAVRKNGASFESYVVPRLLPLSAVGSGADLNEAGEYANLENISQPDDLAYVLYTSGTTGRPKGVMIPHRGVVRLVVNADYLRLSSDDVWLQISSLSFDASTFEIWGSLLNGACLQLAPPGPLDLGALARWTKAGEITIALLTPALFYQWMDFAPESLAEVGQLLVGGDVLSLAKAREYLQLPRHGRLLNAYGPTENSVITCCAAFDRDEELDQADTVPIGRPIGGTEVFIVDAHGRSASMGVEGELLVGGEGLARGYLGAPELTEEKFVRNPFRGDGSRLYRTGDRARWRFDGSIEFLGRTDHQVKIRGHRVELEEIEAVLSRHPDVSGCAVGVSELGGDDRENSADKKLVAYVEGRPGSVPTVESLRAWLAATLPSYMIPSQYVGLSALPRGASGKILRAALAKVDGELLPRGEELEREPVAPRNEIERRVGEIWRSVLGVESIGVNDPFLDLGGHSLQAAAVVARIRQEWRVALPMQALFEAPTVAALAREVESLLRDRDGAGDEAEVAVDRSRPIPMSLGQQRIWFQQQTLPDPATYNEPVAIRLLGPVDADRARRAFAALVERHESLRTSLVQDGENLWQRVASSREVQGKLKPAMAHVNWGHDSADCSTSPGSDPAMRDRNLPSPPRGGGEGLRGGQLEESVTDLRAANFPVDPQVQGELPQVPDACQRAHEPGTSGRAGAPPPAAETVSLNVSADPLGPWGRCPGRRAAESAPYLTAQGEVDVPWCELDLSADPGALQEVLVAEAREPFNLSEAPLWRVRWIQLSPDEQVVLLVFHHSIIDDWSLRVLLREWERLYAVDGRLGLAELPELRAQYADVAKRERRRLSDERRRQKLRSYWQETLRDFPGAVGWPSRLSGQDGPGPASGRGAVYRFSLPETVVTPLRRLAREEAVTVFTAVLATVQLWLGRCTGRADVVVGVPVANRTEADVSGVLGFFLNTVPVRTCLAGEWTFREAVRQVRERVRGALAHADLPFEQIVELAGRRSSGWQRLDQVMLILVEEPPLTVHWGQAEAKSIPVHTGTSKCDLTLRVEAAGPTWDCQLEYATDRLSRDGVRRMAEEWAALLNEVVQSPETAVERLKRGGRAGGCDALAEGPGEASDETSESPDGMVDAGCCERPACGSETGEARALCVHHLIEAQVRARPDATAVVFGSESLTYRELQARADELAHHLRSLGVGPDVLVGILVERSVGMVVGLLGILQAGGAFVPFDPDHPAERLAFMMADARVEVLVTERNLLERCPARPRHVVCLEEIGPVEQHANRGRELRTAPPHPVPIPHCGIETTLSPAGRRRGPLRGGEVHGEMQPAGVDANRGRELRTAPPHPVPIPHCGIETCPLPRSAAERVYAVGGSRDGLPNLRVTNLPVDPPVHGDLRPPSLDALHLAYVIYTSGSTGRPKGVQVSHGALVNALQSLGREPGLGPDDVMLAVTTLSFDIALLELLLPLVVGARVVIVPRAVAMSGQALSQAIAEASATVLQATPATWRMLLAAGWPGQEGLKALCGGETMSRALAQELLPRCRELWNLYGPTETTIWSTCARVTDPDDIHLGRPIANTDLQVLDEARHPVEPGGRGEIYLGGAGVARGYVDRPDLTQEKFVPNPWVPGGRLYRTGDWGRIRSDGNLEYFGRVDFQVKIRGHRIELPEIEAALAEHPCVESAAVVASETGPEEKTLSAYLVVRTPTESALDELRAWLRQRLPAVMMPARFLLVAAMPLTPNGKIDRKALPGLGSTSAPGTGEPSAESRPVDELERQLVRIWKAVLEVDRVGLHDDFFDLGGHSLLAARLFARIESELGVRLPLSSLMSSPTIAALAALIRSASPGAKWKTLVAIRTSGTRPPLFFIHDISGNVLGFQGIVRHLPPEWPVYGVQSVGLDGASVPLPSVQEMAAHYVAELRKVQAEGPYHLASFCVAGVIAYEVARQLREAGHAVGAVLLLDTIPASALTVLSRAKRFLFSTRLLAGRLRRYAVYVFCHSPARWPDLFRQRWRAFSRRVAFYPDRPRITRHNLAACRAYRPPPYPGKVIVLHAVQHPRVYKDLFVAVWSTLACGGVDRYEVPGDHVTFMQEPHVQRLAEQIASCLRAAERQ